MKRLFALALSVLFLFTLSAGAFASYNPEWISFEKIEVTSMAKGKMRLQITAQGGDAALTVTWTFVKPDGKAYEVTGFRPKVDIGHKISKIVITDGIFTLTAKPSMGPKAPSEGRDLLPNDFTKSLTSCALPKLD